MHDCSKRFSGRELVKISPKAYPDIHIKDYENFGYNILLRPYPNRKKA